MTEFWLPVRGWEGIYAVSDLGRVKSMPRIVERSTSWMRIKERILRPGRTKDGYLLVVLSRKDEKQSRHVHGLVAEAFLKKPSDDAEVDHRDRRRHENSPTNLRWASRSQNNGNARHGRGASSFRGVTRGQAGRWAAQMGRRGKHIFLGEYATEAEAAAAYDRAALEYFGQFARLNFPTEQEGATA